MIDTKRAPAGEELRSRDEASREEPTRRPRPEPQRKAKPQGARASKAPDLYSLVTNSTDGRVDHALVYELHLDEQREAMRQRLAADGGDLVRTWWQS